MCFRVQRFRIYEVASGYRGLGFIKFVPLGVMSEILYPAAAQRPEVCSAKLMMLNDLH